MIRRIRTFAIVKVQDALVNGNTLNWSTANNDSQWLFVDLKEGHYKYVIIRGSVTSHALMPTTIIVFNISISDALMICKMFKHDEVVFADMQDEGCFSLQYWHKNGKYFEQNKEIRQSIIVDNDKDYYKHVASLFPFTHILANSIAEYEADLDKRTTLYNVDWLINQCLHSLSGRQKYYCRCRLHGNLQRQLQTIRSIKSC